MRGGCGYRSVAHWLRRCATVRRGCAGGRRIAGSGGRLGEEAPGPVLCTEIDLLFEPSLGLDPLALFRQVSRETALVVAWPGGWDGGGLTYATPEYGHYRAWERPNVSVVGG